MKHFHSFKKSIVLSTLVCLGLTIYLNSCSGTRIHALPEKQTVPKLYGAQGGEDQNIAETPWNSFFQDSVLRALIDTALHRNYDLLMAMQRMEMASANLSARRAALLPSLDLVLSGGAERFGDYTINGVGNFDTNLSPNINDNQKVDRNPTPDYFGGIRSSWEIDLWGKLRAQKKAALAKYLATEKGKQLITTNLIAKVSALYYELLALNNELEIINKNITLQEKALTIVKAQKEGGEATELAVQQFKAQVLKTNALAYHIKQEIVVAENTLNFLLGRFPQTIELGKPLTEQNYPDQLSAGIPAELLLRRPDIQQAELELSEAKFNLHAARAAAFPTLTITPYAGYNSFNASLWITPESFVWGILGGLTTPLFRKKEIRSNFRINSAKQKEAFYAYEQTVINGFQEVVSYLNAIDNLKQIYTYKEQEFSILNNSTSIANDLYFSGHATYLEIITTQRSVLEAELALVETRKEMFHSMSNLYRSLGGGW